MEVLLSDLINLIYASIYPGFLLLLLVILASLLYIVDVIIVIL